MRSISVGRLDLDGLVRKAGASPRLRAHLNLHSSFEEPCQRLLNAIEPDSYIRPHSHPDYTTNETLLAVRGRFVLVEFSAAGEVCSTTTFGMGWGEAVICEVAPSEWHTVLSLEPGSVLFEAKAGPFTPQAAKSYASFAPPEEDREAARYLDRLRREVMQMIGE